MPVVLAAWFHDAVYDALPDAEERSAQWAERALPEPPASEVARLVRMTAHHRPFPDDRNACVLSDADLAILAAPEERYADYAAGVRREYAQVGDADFAAGRAAVLRDLLDGPRLFATDAGARLWETAARANATAEITRLEAQPGRGPEGPGRTRSRRRAARRRCSGRGGRPSGRPRPACREQRAAGVAQHGGADRHLEQAGLLRLGGVGADGVLGPVGAQAARLEGVVQAGGHPALQEAGEQDLVEVGVLDADDLLVGAAQPLPVDDRVARRDRQGAGHARAGLLAAGEQGLRLGQHAAARMSSVKEVSWPTRLAGLGDEGAATGHPLEEPLPDQRVERLAHRHPRDPELGDQLALGGRGGAGLGSGEEVTDVLAHLHVLEAALGRPDVHGVHGTRVRPVGGS